MACMIICRLAGESQEAIPDPGFLAIVPRSLYCFRNCLMPCLETVMLSSKTKHSTMAEIL